MAIDHSGESWYGSEPADIQDFLAAFSRSEGGYPTTAYRSVRCRCGSNRFRLERAAKVTRRTCAECGNSKVICHTIEDWEEAEAEEGAEPLECVACSSDEANISVGFAGYEENPELDAVQWFYVGVRCVECGLLGSFNDGKVGWGPATEVYQSV